jgi:alanyl-tRNA synthetase
VSHRVIADHLRSSCFLLADGVMPSNEGRGYVLRRIMRRAMRHVRQIGCKEPLMHRLVPVLIQEMGDAYPELIRAKALTTEILKLEEERFCETLDRGLKLLEEETVALKAGQSLRGDVAFKLYDTYGFPLDLTKDILRGRDVLVDESGFEASMLEQKERARAAWKGSGETATETLWFDIKDKQGATEFLGYEATKAQGKVTALIVDGKEVQQVSSGQSVMVILNQTPFYAESGGQEGDSGTFLSAKATLDVEDTIKKLGDLHVHVATVTQGTLSLDDVVDAVVDTQRRDALRANHSATHILHAALRELLGEHITQKGSLVAADRFRLDFSHPKALSTEEVAEIERKVNAVIWQNTEVATRLMQPDEAIKAGAMALFGEKYGDEVRVVNMGLSEESGYSVELCGGTHVRRTGDIGLFKILSESAIASGVRRIEAITSRAAFEYLNTRDMQIQLLANALKTTPQQLPDRVQSLLEERKKLEKELTEAKKAAALGGSATTEVEQIRGIPFIGKYMEGISAKDLRAIVGDLQKMLPSGVVAVSASAEGKASLIIAVSDDWCNTISAVTLVQAAAETLGAKGGRGKPGFAQTGGTEAAHAEKAIEVIRQVLAKNQAA